VDFGTGSKHSNTQVTNIMTALHWCIRAPVHLMAYTHVG